MGEFGENCAGRCYCALGATCNVTSGICPDECEVGFEGEFCHIGKFLLYVAHSIRNIITLCKIMVASTLTKLLRVHDTINNQNI